MRNLNKVCNKEIEEPTGQQTIREREKKYKKRENVCSLLYMGPANKQGKKEHALEGKRNPNLRKQASGLDSVTYIDRCRLSFPSSRWSLRQKGKLLFIIILLGIEFYSLFSYLDLDQELGFHHPHKQLEGQSRWSLRQKRKLLFITILLGIEFYSFFSYLDLDQELGFHRPHKQVEGQTKKMEPKKR